VDQTLGAGINSSTARWRETGSVRTWWNYTEAREIEVGIYAVLQVNFLSGAGDDQGGVLDDFFFGRNTSCKVELLLQRLRLATAGQHALKFGAAERVPGMGLGN